MFIQTESTPNPNSLKFILEKYSFCDTPVEFNKTDKNINSDLAERLFEINGVENILFNQNFVSINKKNYSWDQLKASILQVISKHVESGLPAIKIENNCSDDLNEIEFDIEDKEIVENIAKIINSKIRRAVMQDGGDVKFNKYESGIVYLSLKGSCAGCPSATMTLKNGIENLLKSHIAEIQKVEQVI